MTMRERRFYRGRSLYLWTRDGAWLWLFADGGAIGAAASKNQAVGEGRSVIDQFLRRSGGVEAVDEAEVQFGTQPQSRTLARDGYWKGWNNALDGLARHLATA